MLRPSCWLWLVLLPPIAFAQQPLGDEERGRVLDQVDSLLKERYVSAEVAEACRAQLRVERSTGRLDELTDPSSFAQHVTDLLQAVSSDRHLWLKVRDPDEVREARDDPARARARRDELARQSNHGFERVERLEGNIGYLDLRSLSPSPEAREVATAAMTFLARADALVLDLRLNEGGSPEMVRFLCSYLLAERTHLNTFHWRVGDRKDELWSLEEVPGPRLSEVPVIVLTSPITFSGAEGLAYHLQALGRATVVGTATGGGAHPGSRLPVGERFLLFLPQGRAVNPITGTNWEGSGVTPDVAVEVTETFSRGLAVALAAAREHQEQRLLALDAGLRELQDELGRAVADGGTGGASRAASVLRVAAGDGLVSEAEINAIGYRHLGEGRHELATAVLALNAELHPQSANVHDSLGEALAAAGETERAVASYRRSLELDPGNANARRQLVELGAPGSVAAPPRE
ncbi:MAG: S41 family peptidase [Acidobacteriota bacterium]